MSPRAWKIVLGVLAVTIAAGMFAVVVSLTASGRVEMRVGDDEFVVGQAAALATRIRDDGGAPLLFADAAGGQRDVYVIHTGEDPATGWLVVEARRPGTDRTCTLVWEPDPTPGRFTDPCGGAPVPAGGAGLRTYPARVDEGGTLIVDLRTATTTTSAPGEGVTTTTAPGGASGT